MSFKINTSDTIPIEFLVFDSDMIKYNEILLKILEKYLKMLKKF